LNDLDAEKITMSLIYIFLLRANCCNCRYCYILLIIGCSWSHKGCAEGCWSKFTWIWLH